MENPKPHYIHNALINSAIRNFKYFLGSYVKNMHRQKIYDCFTFFNELDLLEIRFSELYDVVDYFVLVEAKQTHSGKSKKLIFKNNKDRFKKWADKIIYIETDLPTMNFLDKTLVALEKTWAYGFVKYLTINFALGTWKLENFQRNCIRKGLSECENDDVVMVSDIDEIPNPERVRDLLHALKHHKFVGFEQKLFYYYLNGLANRSWFGTKAVLFSTLKKDLGLKPQRVRVLSPAEVLLKKWGGDTRKEKILKNGGWHFTYMGGEEKIKEKLRSFAHQELKSQSTREKIDSIVSAGRHFDPSISVKHIALDETFPKTIINNVQKYKHLIKS